MHYSLYMDTTATVHCDRNSSESTSDAVIQKIAVADGVDPIEVHPPLHDAINPDALNAIFTPRHDGTPWMTGYVTFRWGQYQVTVHSDGEIQVGEWAETGPEPESPESDT